MANENLVPAEKNTVISAWDAGKLAEMAAAGINPADDNMLRITLRGGRVIAMRRPKVKDQRFAQKAGGGDPGLAESVLFVSLCGLTSPAELDEFDVDDYQRLTRGYESFLLPV